MYGNKYSDQLLPLITPTMLTRYPDQTCDILNKLIRLAQKSSTTTVEGGGEGNLEDIVQTTTSYADGGVNVVTAYLSDGTTQDFQIRNGHQGSQGDPGTPGTPGADGQDATIAVGTTTTLPAGSNATVTDSGTPSAAVLDFGIPRGADGQNGQDGQDGFSPIATVSKVGDTATITITDENGTTTATVTDGSDGAPGQAATVTAGTTTTLPAGSSASVTNSGTSSAAIFDFSIPKGDTGAAGQDGADGADGFSPIANVTKVGDTATITITDENGTTTATVTDGTNGTPGAAATIAAGTTTTLSPGSSATVTNSGTSSAAVFDFGIPQGATGAPGADGADGADGFSPIATVNKVGDTATITITDENGTTTATVTDGANGSPGPANTLSIGTVQSGATADATITGTAPNQTLNLTLPKGDTGSAGAAATIAVGNTTTLPAGSSATVSNSGTSSAAVFDFGIPKGADGQDANVVNAYSTSSSDAYSASYINNLMNIALSSSTVVSDGITLPTGVNEIKFDNGLMIAFGNSVVLSGVSPNSYRDYSWTLNTPFIAPPVVIASITSDSTGTNFGQNVAANNYTTTGNSIKVRFFNGSSTNRSPFVSFVAFGKWK